MIKDSLEEIDQQLRLLAKQSKYNFEAEDFTHDDKTRRFVFSDKGSSKKILLDCIAIRQGEDSYLINMGSSYLPSELYVLEPDSKAKLQSRHDEILKNVYNLIGKKSKFIAKKSIFGYKGYIVLKIDGQERKIKLKQNNFGLHLGSES